MEERCMHCGRYITEAPGTGKGWRHVVGWFVSCHPGHTGTTLAEPEPREAA